MDLPVGPRARRCAFLHHRDQSGVCLTGAGVADRTLCCAFLREGLYNRRSRRRISHGTISDSGGRDTSLCTRSRQRNTGSSCAGRHDGLSRICRHDTNCVLWTCPGHCVYRRGQYCGSRSGCATGHGGCDSRQDPSALDDAHGRARVHRRGSFTNRSDGHYRQWLDDPNGDARLRTAELPL